MTFLRTKAYYYLVTFRKSCGTIHITHMKQTRFLEKALPNPAPMGTHVIGRRFVRGVLQAFQLLILVLLC